MNKNTIEKQFRLTTAALNNRTSVFVLTLILIIAGISSYISLPKESFPEIKQPIVYVGTPHPGNSPVDIENLITRPIEKEINTISDIDNIKSTSVQDYSTIIVEFAPNIETSDALTKVKDAVDRSKPELPSDLESEPNIFELNFSEFPILSINLSGNFTLEKLNVYAEYLQEEIEKISEISKADIRGVDKKELLISVDPYQMEAREIGFQDIEDAIRFENLTLSGGNIKEGNLRRSLRIIGEFEYPEELLDIIVKQEEGNIVYLKDIAKVSFGYKEKESYARLDGAPVVKLDVVKRSGENLLIATEKIDVILQTARKDIFPKDLRITITNDQSQQTRDMVSSLENNIISGIILVVLVLLFFLGTRNALFVGMAIPLSMFMAFMILGIFGVTINMMVLFSLIMALGMLVDNGIVVVENTYRLMQEGCSAFEATKRGVGEVALPIIASTATTLAAFLPLAFWPGIMGEFMKFLPITLMITLGSSLFVALVINPVLISTFMKVVDDQLIINHKRLWKMILIFFVIGLLLLLADAVLIGNLSIIFSLLIVLNVYVLSPLSSRFQNSLLIKIENYYSQILSFALSKWRPIAFFFGTILLLIFSLGLMMIFPPSVQFFPINEPAYVNVFIQFPLGTDVEHTNNFAKKIEDRTMDVITPYRSIVESVTTNVGEGASDPNDPSASGGPSSTPNKARITINFVEYKDRGEISTTEVMEKLRSSMKGFVGVTVTVDKDASGPPTGKPISIEIAGKGLKELIRVAEDMKKQINQAGIYGIEKLKLDIETSKPELLIDIDRENTRRFGLSTSRIAGEIRTALFGKEISKFKQGEDDYEIQLRLEDKYRYDIETLINRSITFRDQNSGTIHQVPISSVAKPSLSSTYGSIRRKDLNRVVTLSSNVESGANATVINNDIKNLLSSYAMPTGYNFKFGGEQEQQAEELSFLSKALMIAVFIIFLIIVLQFNKVTTPFIIMMSVFLSTIGVFLGLIIFNMDFIIIMTMIGIISLAGIVVNNAIVLIDFIELERKRKRAELQVNKLPFEEIIQSIIFAGKTRLRPVLLTAITTVLGLIPLAIGINIDFISFFNTYNANFYLGGDNVIFWGPMSWTIIFGLTFATFLTLIIVPIMYLFFAKVSRKLGMT